MIKIPEHYEKVDLKAGKLCIVEKPTVVWTILGSCVALVFHHKKSKMSAICHAQLPEEQHPEYKCSIACPTKCLSETPESNRFKYVACSARYMLESFLNKGISKNAIEVKLFGGANVLNTKGGRETVGEQNIRVAMGFIAKNRLNLVGKDIGGELGRTMYFYSDTGEVLLRTHKKSLHSKHF